MPTNADRIPVDEYLRTSYKPACDYIDGVLRQKAWPNYNHSKMQLRVSLLVDQLHSGFDAVPELTVRIRETKYLVPDVAVQRVSELQQPYPLKPIFLCVEILSPEDRFSEIVAKCEDYHEWGVPHCWVIDPERMLCWEYQAGERPSQRATGDQITAGEIVLAVDDLFAEF